VPSYKERYAEFKDEVDAIIGRPRGRWARFKTFFLPNSFSADRKSAIDKFENSWTARKTRMDMNAAKLYQAHNVIGSTRAPGQRPTVYYRSGSGTFGHITQEHDLLDNVGREPAGKHAQYSFGNTGPEGQLQEKFGAYVFHQSRNPFVPAQSDEERESLGQAHRDFPRLKQLALKQARERSAKRVLLAR
jgi:hypothetical protein